MSHPSRRLDDVVHQRARLGILAILAEARSADFGYLREALGLTDGNLSRHLTVLEEAGLVRIEKGFEGRRPRTRVRATRRGAAALRAELDALRDLIGRVDGAGAAGRGGEPGAAGPPAPPRPSPAPSG